MGHQGLNLRTSHSGMTGNMGVEVFTPRTHPHVSGEGITLAGRSVKEEQPGPRLQRGRLRPGQTSDQATYFLPVAGMAAGQPARHEGLTL